MWMPFLQPCVVLYRLMTNGCVFCGEIFQCLGEGDGLVLYELPDLTENSV